MKKLSSLLICLPCWVLAATDASENTLKKEPLHSQAAQFIRTEIGQTENIQVTVQPFDLVKKFPECVDPLFFLPGQLPVLRGSMRIGLRCTKPSAWVIYSKALVQEATTRYQLKTDLPMGHVIRLHDLLPVSSFQKESMTGANSNPQQFVGRTLTRPLLAGTVLQSNLTQNNWLVKGGQNVTVVSAGAGFKISSEARALGNAVFGQLVQVRTASGQILSANVLSDGSVETTR